MPLKGPSWATQVEGELQRSLWDLTQYAFAPLNASTIMRQSPTFEEFDALSRDESILKVVSCDEAGEPSQFTTVHTEVDGILWVDQDYLHQEFGDSLKKGVFRYLGLSAVRTSGLSPETAQLAQVVSELRTTFNERQALYNVGFDFTSKNRALARLFAYYCRVRTPELEVVQGRREYYAFAEPQAIDMLERQGVQYARHGMDEQNVDVRMQHITRLGLSEGVDVVSVQSAVEGAGFYPLESATCAFIRESHVQCE